MVPSDKREGIVMLESGAGRPAWLCAQGDDPELALSHWIMATILVESFTGSHAVQLPPSRMMRVLLLMQEMDRLVQNLQALLQGDYEKHPLRNSGDSQRVGSPVAFRCVNTGIAARGGVVVLGVFAANLRRLCSSRGVSLAQAARDLDMGKVQFQRLLRAESFPKPNLLQRVCAYFETDARILTEPWPFSPRPPSTSPDPLMGLLQAARYAGLGPAYLEPDPGLRDGHYTFFRRSMSLSGQIARSVVQIKTLENCRILRAYDVPLPSAHGWPPRSLREREFRGLVLRQAVGTTILLVHEAAQALSSIYLQPQTSHFADTRYYGVTNYGRMSQPEVTNTSRVVWVAVPPKVSLILRAHRARGLYKPDAVPQDIADFLLHPL